MAYNSLKGAWFGNSFFNQLKNHIEELFLHCPSPQDVEIMSLLKDRIGHELGMTSAELSAKTLWISFGIECVLLGALRTCDFL